MIYTFLIQHNVTKEVYSFTVDDLTPESYYHQFEIQLPENITEGEWEYVLMENPDELEIKIDTDNILNSKLIGGDTIIETFDLLKIADNKVIDYVWYKE